VTAIAAVGCDNNDTASSTGTGGTTANDTRTATGGDATGSTMGDAMREAGQETADAGRSAADATGDAARGAAGATADAGRQAGDAAGDAARNTRDAAAGAADDAQTAAARTGGATTRQAQEGMIGENVSDQEKQFILQAASAGLFEIQSSELAQEKAANDQATKQFAEKMIADHEPNSDELKRIATRLNVNVPTELLPQHQQLLDQLKNAPADQFAKKYHDVQNQAHQQTLQLYQKAQATVQNQDLKAYVQKTIPVLQQHQQALQGHQH
jgi:putative membrane protein